MSLRYDLGDEHPLVAPFASREHRANSADWAKRSGVDVLPMHPDVEAFMRSPGGKELLARGKTSTLFRELAALEERHGEDLTRICREACRGADLVCSTIVTVFRGASLAEALDVPHVCLATLPMFKTASFGSYLLPIPDYHVGWVNRLSWDLYIAAYWLGAAACRCSSRPRCCVT